jgi:parvulin-like peptidyl-prolyl isomerase
VIVTSGRDQARRAAGALRDGITPEKVVGKYSTDAATRQQGGQISFSAGMETKKVDRLVFAADTGAVVGPVKGNRGWLVFKTAGKRQPAYTPSFKQAKAQLAAQMNAERNGKAQQAWNKKFTAKYKPKTLCAEGFELSAFCGNVKPPKLPDVEVNGAPQAPKPR